MKKRTMALLVCDQAEPIRVLEESLKCRSLKLRRANNCAEATRALARVNPPHLVFTWANLPDGTWTDVLGIAARAKQPVNVIVVSRVVDTKLYVEVMENGAFDFIVPPVQSGDLDHIVRCATDNVLLRREALVPKHGQRTLGQALLARGVPTA